MKLFLGSKKGFDVNQAFIFITAVVVVGFVLLFGYKAIDSFLDTSVDIENLQLRKELEEVISKTKNDHGSQRFFDLKLPGDFETLCFFDIQSARSNGEESCPSELRTINPRLCPFWENNFDVSVQQKNMIFVTDDGEIAEPLFIEGLRIESDDESINEVLLCVESSVTNVKLRGERQQVYLSVAE